MKCSVHTCTYAGLIVRFKIILLVSCFKSVFPPPPPTPGTFLTYNLTFSWAQLLPLCFLFFAISLAWLGFLARVTILRNCEQSITLKTKRLVFFRNHQVFGREIPQSRMTSSPQVKGLTSLTKNGRIAPVRSQLAGFLPTSFSSTFSSCLGSLLM